MMESFFVVYLLTLFIFPLPVLWGTLAAATGLFLYKKYLLLKFQPEDGRTIIFLSSATKAANILVSLLLAFALAYTINFWVFDFYYLFLFNLIFAFAVSLRWFDFTHAVYRHFILKHNTRANEPQSVFVTCLGFRKGTGLGLGMTPVFMDSGYLLWRDETIFFDGVFLKQLFDATCVSHVEKRSSERIRVFLKTSIHPLHPDTVLLVLKNQFHPFKSRDTRDKIFRKFLKLQQPEPG